MIVLASGHQVRCIPWVQMGTFNNLRDRLFMWIKSPRCIWNYMFDGIISSPSYIALIQDNLWRIKPCHIGNIQYNGLVWHLWFDPTLSVQHNRLIISWVENILTLYLLNFYKKFDYAISCHFCRQWNDAGSWNSPQEIQEPDFLHGQ